MTSNKRKYKRLCEVNRNISLFQTFEWYNTLFNTNEWEVAIVERGEKVVGFLPYTLTKKKTFNVINSPILTPYQGVWLDYPESQKYANRLGFEKEIISELIDQLPKTDLFQQKFAPDFTNWLPFCWKGFEQSTRYTYILRDLTDEEQLFSNFKENIRREIRKAEKKLAISSATDVDLLFNLKEEGYKRNNSQYPITQESLKKVYDFVIENKCGELLIAQDEEGNVHSVLLYVWDDNSAYYLQGVTNGDFKTSGSMSLLLWEAIKRSAKQTKSFNFEGSMVESIERYFRAFGGELVPYFEIKKTSSKFLKLLNY